MKTEGRLCCALCSHAYESLQPLFSALNPLIKGGTQAPPEGSPLPVGQWSSEMLATQG